MTEYLPDDVLDGLSSVNPLRRIGQADEVAGACCFLLSKASSYVTGQVINVSGGDSVQNILPYVLSKSS